MSFRRHCERSEAIQGCIRNPGTRRAPERIRLIEHLLASLDKPEPEIEAAWAEEAERRLDAYLSGETAARDADEVLAKP